MLQHAMRHLVLSAALCAPGVAGEITLEPRALIECPDGAEIVAFDPETSRIFVSGASGLAVLDLDERGLLSLAQQVDLSTVFESVLSVSSVAVDPRGRGFVAAAVIPSDNTSTRGRVVLIHTSTGAILASFQTGYHPDMVCFTSDADAILVADEGESTDTSDAPGGLTVIDLSSVASAEDLTDARAMTFDFVNDLDASVDLANIRPCPVGSGEGTLALEPEYIAPDPDGAWISLQENDALARFDFATMRFTRIVSLGLVERILDASDRDGAARPNDAVFALPMPDAIASYEVDDRRYIILSEEGDPRGEEMRFSKAVERGMIDPGVLDALNARYDGDAAHPDALGRLDLSPLDGDLDGDGDIDRVVAIGARSFSIVDADTGKRVSDSGNDFERITAERLGPLFNAESDEQLFDSRSDNRGPEPEGIALLRAHNCVYALIGLERSGAIMVYDITDPTSPRFADLVRTKGVAPEGICVATVDDRTFVVVASEVSRTVETFEVVYAKGLAEAVR